jgi:hypothetical protein
LKPYESNQTTFSLSGKRVLIVTVNNNRPALTPMSNGMNIVSDLTGAGYPFDVVTYNRFVKMDFSPSDQHDIIFLNGHTSPVDGHKVAAKCQEAINSERKIFINGHLPYFQYDKNGKQLTSVIFSEAIFDLQYNHSWIFGRAKVPKAFEKDPFITRKGHRLKQTNTFKLKKSPEIKITMGSHIVGFLTPKGGAIDGSSDYLLNLLDYGKVVGYLRYGRPEIVGFANDRINGQPIVSLEVHCDTTNNISAIDHLENIANEFQIPFTNLLVWSRSTDASIKRWNKASKNPLMFIGSHSRNHPKLWPQIKDLHDETIGAINDQRKSIPKTGNYFNFSGWMNPSKSQIDELAKSDIIFGAQGKGQRMLGLPFSNLIKHYRKNPIKRFFWKVLNRLLPPIEIQLLPTCEEWFLTIAKTDSIPFCLSQTLKDDFKVIKNNQNYTEEAQKSFYKNIKYGLYSYGYIHDYTLDRQGRQSQTQGILLRDQIIAAIKFFTFQKVAFISTETLIRRLRDFICGWIDYETLPDGSLQVTVNRKASLANQVKIEQRDQKLPRASGECVIGQTICDKVLYVDLKPEETSSFKVSFHNR